MTICEKVKRYFPRRTNSSTGIVYTQYFLGGVEIEVGIRKLEGYPYGRRQRIDWSRVVQWILIGAAIFCGAVIVYLFIGGATGYIQ